MNVRVTLPADARSPAEARRLVHRSLREWNLVALLDATELLVSELVTNAVLHARTEAELVLTADGERLRVEVCDGSPVHPRTRRQADTAATGRGLRLLDALADRWGVVPNGAGKCVWFAIEPGEGRPDDDPR